MSQRFVHLHLHSEYSLLDSTIRIKKLHKAVAEAGMGAVALTDLCNLFALVKHYKGALGAGIKPVFGAEIWVQDDHFSDKPFRLLLLIQNNQGYLNLTRLISRGYTEGQRAGLALVQREWLEQEAACDGLLALSGALDGDLGPLLLQAKDELASERLQLWQAVFPGRFFIELQRTGRKQEDDYVKAACVFAQQQNTPLVATNAVRFLQESDFEAHEVRVCINDGRILEDQNRPRRYSPQQYLRSADEMCELFADIPSALSNTVAIAEACNLQISLGKNYLPQFPIPAGYDTDSYFRKVSADGLNERLNFLQQKRQQLGLEALDPQVYRERLDFELNVIIQMQFPGYFLIVADFIQWAKDNGIPVGPGRGSGAGSLVAYALKITDLDPLEFELLFERFLNPERVSMPDFDIDFCVENRDRVIDYVAEEYGRNQVSQIITFGTMAAKAVVRDVGRVLGYAYGFVDRIAKLVPFELGITLEKALDDPDLKKAYDEEEDVRAIIDMALHLEGLTRNVGKHAGGVLIAPSDLTDFTPLYCEENGGSLVSQYDKKDVEDVGLVKFDFLGLRNLTIIEYTLRTINQQREAEGQEAINISAIEMQDRASFDLLQACQTTAIFQLESRGMKDLIRRLQPDCFEDIVALVALFRPGPLQSGMVDDFINRKHGLAAVEYPHADLEPILKPTYGTILYQEQVMQIAQVLAGYSLGGADLLRRAMGKKDADLMAQQKDIFVKGSVERGVGEALAREIFDLMEKFAAYGFNKSHSAAYALVSYQTAWLKAHYPAAFMAAVLSSDMDKTDKVVPMIEECRQMGLKLIAPQVNRSDYRFEMAAEDTVIYGLGAIKGVGQGAIESIIEARQQAGDFRDLLDFCMRVDLQKVNKRVLEALIDCGAFDFCCSNRNALMQQLPMALAAAEQQQRNEAVGMFDLFAENDMQQTPELKIPDAARLTESERLEREKSALGLYLSGHPIDQYQDELKQVCAYNLGYWNEKLAPTENGDGAFRQGQEAKVAGLVVSIRTRFGNNGKEAFVLIDDRHGRVEMRLFPEVYAALETRLDTHSILLVEGKIRFDDFSGGLSMRPRQIEFLEDYRHKNARILRIDLGQWPQAEQQLPRLAETLKPYQKATGLKLEFGWDNAEQGWQIQLQSPLQVEVSQDCLASLSTLLPKNSVSIRYG